MKVLGRTTVRVKDRRRWGGDGNGKYGIWCAAIPALEYQADYDCVHCFVPVYHDLRASEEPTGRFIEKPLWFMDLYAPLDTYQRLLIIHRAAGEHYKVPPLAIKE
ncbi:hypothetical protein HZH66_001288 [Vespula vulgaris]|uniref:Uncharacterized protein n=1 Tax=Vespula vulgaris TaxID=7454 RepID=A0A834KUR6_VESVU|nr:hypothetical protein HZH66_001288 [Vespula vulgaris]